jgi:hypothetical protein
VKSGTVKPVRCAIYTRVSTDHGLEQDFNSLDARYPAYRRTLFQLLVLAIASTTA